jgi:hypothetical protein
MVGMNAEAVEPACEGRVVDAKQKGDVGTSNTDTQQEQGKFDEWQWVAEAKGGGVAADGEDVAARLAAQAANGWALTLVAVGDKGMDSGIGDAEIGQLGERPA